MYISYVHKVRQRIPHTLLYMWHMLYYSAQTYKKNEIMLKL